MRNLLHLLPMIVLVAGCSAASEKQASPVATGASTQESPDPLAADIGLINQSAPPATVAFRPEAGSAASGEAVSPANHFAIRAEAMLARAHFSPGVVDGQYGTNFKNAVSAYQKARGLAISGSIDSLTWQTLLAEPTAGLPTVLSYTITDADVAGPFADDVGENLVELAALPDGPHYASPLEALAERFHMSQTLLQTLNPAVNFATAGGRIIVVDADAPAFTKGDVARVDVAKSDASVRAYDKAGKLIAFYPATVGSTERPSPSGAHAVVGVSLNPNYTYDPSKLAWGPRAAGKLVIRPGPNNPVGTVWIDLNAPGYGLHGTPEPDKIGKTASHGCVRLTNWDAQALAAGIKPGAAIRFVGTRGGRTRR